jgi:hypothetical protein
LKRIAVQVADRPLCRSAALPLCCSSVIEATGWTKQIVELGDRLWFIWLHQFNRSLP